MIQSMTGFGRSTASLDGKSLIIEIRSLNSKQFDLNLRIPSFLREHEYEIRQLLSRKLERGKIELNINLDSQNGQVAGIINKPLFRQYLDELTATALESGTEVPSDIFSIALKMPDVISSSKEDTAMTDAGPLLAGIEEVIDQVVTFRVNEGAVIEADMLVRVHAILKLLDAIEPFEKQRINSIRERLVREFARYGDESSGPVADPNRFEQELIFYLEKLDITEEKVRLWKHCGYFLETLKESGNQGKKIGFVTQEMGREINTIGSKANDADIQRMVVQMKDELEKIREQLGNVL
jgi:uncharacterized protein (TIGR00255 family)